MLNEQELVARIIKADFRAFRELVSRYEKLVFFMVGRLVRERADQEDICQEVFIKVFKQLPKFRFESKLSTWIARIAYLTTVSYLQKHRHIRFYQVADPPANEPAGPDNPESLLIKKDQGVCLESLISILPDQYRTVITLYHLGGFSCEEIAGIVGTPEGTVKSWLFRARQMLKEQVQLKQIKNDFYE